MFLSGETRGKGRGPLLISTIFNSLPLVTQVHLVTGRGSSPEACYIKLGFKGPTPLFLRVFSGRMSTNRIYMTVTREEFQQKRDDFYKPNGEATPPAPATHGQAPHVDLRELHPEDPTHSSLSSRGLNDILLDMHAYHGTYGPICRSPPNLIPSLLSGASHLISIYPSPSAPNPPATQPPNQDGPNLRNGDVPPDARTSAPDPSDLGPQLSEMNSPPLMGAVTSNNPSPGSPGISNASERLRLPLSFCESSSPDGM